MAKVEDEGWSFVEVSGSTKVLVVGDWLDMTCVEAKSLINFKDYKPR